MKNAGGLSMKCTGFPHLKIALDRHWLGTEIPPISNYISQSEFQQYFIRRLQPSGLKVIFVPLLPGEDISLVSVSRENSKWSLRFVTMP